MKFDVRYRTLLTYSELVVESQNEIRACPASDPFQELTSYEVSVHPGTDVYSFVDGWGTKVDTFGVRLPHLAMEVVAEAVVETSPRVRPTASAPIDSLDDPSFAEANFEYLQRGRHTGWGDAVAAAAADLRASHTTVESLADAVHDFVRAQLRYEPGATHIGIAVDTVLADGVGVCQDYAHLAVALCRAIGLPARYVSGYFFTAADDDGSDTTAAEVTVQTHAWFEAALPGSDWLALDPTNGQPVAERHVKIGHGRDYDDVMPFRGVFLGPATSDVEAKVDIRRQQGAGPDDAAGTPYPLTTSPESAVRLANAEAAAQAQQ